MTFEVVLRFAALVSSGLLLSYVLFKAWESEERPKIVPLKIAALMLIFLGTIFL